MSAGLMEALQERTQAAHANIAALAARVARRLGVEVGQRVTFRYGEVTMHGFVVELARRPADDLAGAWVRVIGFSAWVHFCPLDEVQTVCGICPDCLRMNDKPGCLDRPRVQP